MPGPADGDAGGVQLLPPAPDAQARGGRGLDRRRGPGLLRRRPLSDPHDGAPPSRRGTPPPLPDRQGAGAARRARAPRPGPTPGGPELDPLRAAPRVAGRDGGRAHLGVSRRGGAGGVPGRGAPGRSGPRGGAASTPVPVARPGDRGSRSRRPGPDRHPAELPRRTRRTPRRGGADAGLRAGAGALRPRPLVPSGRHGRAPPRLPVEAAEGRGPSRRHTPDRAPERPLREGVPAACRA